MLKLPPSMKTAPPLESLVYPPDKVRFRSTRCVSLPLVCRMRCLPPPLSVMSLPVPSMTALLVITSSPPASTSRLAFERRGKLDRVCSRCGVGLGHCLAQAELAVGGIDHVGRRGHGQGCRRDRCGAATSAKGAVSDAGVRAAACRCRSRLMPLGGLVSDPPATASVGTLPSSALSATTPTHDLRSAMCRLCSFPRV